MSIDKLRAKIEAQEAYWNNNSVPGEARFQQALGVLMGLRWFATARGMQYDEEYRLVREWMERVDQETRDV